MSSRVAEKQRRRAERDQREQQRTLHQQRGRRLRSAAATTLAVVLAAIIATTAVRGGSGSSEPKKRIVSASAQPFGQHYAGLQRRREQAGVPTMMDTMSRSLHYHPTLALFVDGRQIAIPANVGIDPTKDPMDMAGLHTHDTTGTIHVEGAPHATLGKFFAIWEVPLSANQVGPYRAKGNQTVRMWVNGKPSRAFGALKLANGQKIVISYGSGERPPTAR